MTDIEKLKLLFKEFGVGYSVEEREEHTVLEIEAKVHEKVVGYGGFTSDYVFDKSGKFIEVGVWE